MTQTDVVGPPSPNAGRPAPAIHVEGLCKRYADRQVLDGLSFEVMPGEIFGLLGSNGAGKTTAVEILQGLRTRDAGSVEILGLDPQRERARLRHLVGSQLQVLRAPRAAPRR